MATTLPDGRYLKRARDEALASAASVYATARTSTGRATFTAWCDRCAACDRSEPGFSASHLHRGSGLELAKIAPVAICVSCGSTMERIGVASTRFAADSQTARAALERVLGDHLRVLTRRLTLASSPSPEI